MKKNGKFFAILLSAAMTAASVLPASAQEQTASAGTQQVETVQTEQANDETETDESTVEETAAAETETQTTAETAADQNAQETTASVNAETTADGQTASETTETDQTASAVPVSVDNSTSLPDGEYTDVTVTATGGTSRTKFTCSKVTVSGGRATAHITISSKSYTDFFLGTTEGDAQAIDAQISSSAAGSLYKTSVSGKTASADLPVSLGQPMAVAGRTTAMSKVHWINYSLTVTVNNAPSASCAVSFPLQDENGRTISGTVTVTDENGNAVLAAEGTYTLTQGKTYTVTAQADGYEDKTITYTATGDASVPVQLNRQQSEAVSLNITNNATMFKVINAQLLTEDGRKYLKITMNGQGYHALYKGTLSEAKEKAAHSKDSWIQGRQNDNKKWEFLIPVKDGENEIPIVAISNRYASKAESFAEANHSQVDYTSAFYQKKLVIDTQASALTVSDGETASAGQSGSDTGNTSGSNVGSNTGGNDAGSSSGQSSSGKTSQTGTAAGSQDTAGKGSTSGSARAGSYIFRWSGGSGRINIRFISARKSGGQLYATIRFVRADGSSASYSQVRSLGTTVSGTNTFEIPVNENANTSIQALTTAMSASHWIDYTIYVGTEDAAAGATESTVSVNTETLDEEAPEIFGLTAEDNADEDGEDFYADHFRIFRYEGGYRLIEIDIAEDTALENTDTMEKDAEDDNLTSVKLYKQNVLKYLVVPEGAQVPVGLENDVILVQQPLENAYLASRDALDMFDQLEADDRIAALGLQTGEDDDITFAGTYDDWDLKAMAKADTDLIIQPADLLPQDEKDIENFLTLYNKESDNADTLGIPVIIDRSGDEVNDLAKAEWIKVYGTLLGQEEQAEELFQKVLSSAGRQDREEALKAVKN